MGRRRSSGRRPGPPFKLEGTIASRDGLGWEVYAKPVTETGWRNIKLVAVLPSGRTARRVDHKCNLWLGVHELACRWARGADTVELLERWPEVAAELARMYDADFDTDEIM